MYVVGFVSKFRIKQYEKVKIEILLHDRFYRDSEDLLLAHTNNRNHLKNQSGSSCELLFTKKHNFFCHNI